jgi:roadblock/LC7 domain-containing protein
VAFSRDGKTIATASDDKTARLWSSATGQPLGPPLQHQDAVIAVAFSRDGKTIATASKDKTARLWSAATGQPLGPPLQHQSSVGAVAFSPDGKTIATASWDKTARLWSAATGQPLGPLLQHQGGVEAVAFSRDGKTIATASWDQTARLWSAATGQPVGPPLQHQGRVVAVAFSPDGKTIATASADKTARIWEVPVAAGDDHRHIELWTQAATATELDRHGGIVSLDREAWEERRRRLDKMGGPPALGPSDALTVARRRAWAFAADMAWHHGEAISSLRSKQWFAGRFHLRAQLTLWKKRLAENTPESRADVQKALQHWQEDPALAAIRNPAALAKLPKEEQDACRKLWADVDALLKKATSNH